MCSSDLFLDLDPEEDVESELEEALTPKDDEPATDTDPTREILELADMAEADPAVFTSSNISTTGTASTPEVPPPNSTDATDGAANANGTETTLIRDRARAALARAKAANRARKQARRASQAGNRTDDAAATTPSTGTVTITSTATATSNSTVRDATPRRTASRRRNGRRSSNHSSSAIPVVDTVVSGTNQTAQTTENDDVPVPITKLRGPPARLTSRVDQDDFKLGFFSTIGVVCMIVTATVAGVGIMANLNGEKAAGRRVSLAPSLIGVSRDSAMSTSATFGLDFGGLQQRPVAGRRCSESLPL